MVIRNSYRSWKSKDPAEGMTVHATMENRISVADFLAWMAKEHPHIDPATVLLNWGTAAWDDKATEEELAERANQQAAQEARQEAWERKTYQRLKEKFEDLAKIHPPWSESQVDALNAFQSAGEFHAFTCPREHDSFGSVALKLNATTEGWVCEEPDCGYTQGWAHAFMAGQ